MVTYLQTPANTFEWVDISEPTRESLGEIAEKHGLNSYAVRDCLDPGHLPKYELLAGDVHFVIFRLYSPNENPEGHTIQELTNKIAIFYTDKLLLTVHRLSQDFIPDFHKNCIGEGRTDEPRELVTKILGYILHSYEQLMHQLTDEIDRHESTIFLKESPRGLEQSLYFLKRKASVTRRVLELTGDVIARLQTSPEDSSSLQDARDLHVKLVGTYTQVYEDVNTLLNTHLAISSERTNNVMRVLTIFSAFFLPLTFIAGIYGMNFDVMPELRHPYGYFITIAMMFIMAVGIYVWFKRKKWL
jgi:magnesium transporter